MVISGPINVRGESLYTIVDGFSWEELDAQASKSWDNAVFKEQNPFEAFDEFVGSLESPTSNVLEADGDTDANNEDMLGTNFQEII